MALSIPGTSVAVDTAGGTLAVTFLCPSGFKIGDEFFFGANTAAALVNSPRDSNGNEWYTYEFSRSGGSLGDPLYVFTFAVEVGSPLIGQTSKTFTFNGGGFGIQQVTGGLAAPGVVLRGGAGASSEHSDDGGVGFSTGTHNDYNISASGVTPRVMSVPAHSGEVGDASHQKFVYAVARFSKASITVTSFAATSTMTDLGSIIDAATHDNAVWAGYQLLSVGASAEAAYDVQADWTGGGSGQGDTFRIVRKMILTTLPVARLNVTPAHGLAPLLVTADATGSAEE